MILSNKPSFCFENNYAGHAVGFDEVGYGAWAGPVYAGAAFVDKNTPLALLNLLNDSKKLTAKKRQHLYSEIKSSPFIKFSIGISTVEEIDTLNIRQATFLAMERAYETLGLTAEVALIDGTGKPQLPCPVHTVVKGDSKSFSIAAASIVAKVERDAWMAHLSRDFPQYHWSSNVGYGTQKHQNALKEHGVTPHHRRSYKPIQDLLLGKSICHHSNDRLTHNNSHPASGVSYLVHEYAAH